MRWLAILLLSLPATAQTVQPMDPPSPMLLQCWAENGRLWFNNEMLIEEVKKLKDRAAIPKPVAVKPKPKRLPCKKGRTRKNGVCGRW